MAEVSELELNGSRGGELKNEPDGAVMHPQLGSSVGDQLSLRHQPDNEARSELCMRRWQSISNLASRTSSPRDRKASASFEKHPPACDQTLLQWPQKPDPVHLKPQLDEEDCPSFFSSSVTSLQQCCVTTNKKRASKSSKMGLSKEQRICILLAIDSAFFLLELIIGYAVHSLALVADAFHMLNDVLSLCVGLWAVRVAQSGSSKMYTYGWQRAETLGALVNGVFLVALCVTIFLEAIQRFVEKPNVTNPKLVLIVGCLGLASNLVGLVLFHDVGHSHGPGGRSHGDEEAQHSHEEGQVHDHTHEHQPPTENSPLVKKHSHNHGHPRFSTTDEDSTTVASRQTTPNRTSIDMSGRHRRRTSGFGSVDNIQIHPASFRHDIIQAARYQDEPLEEEALLTDGLNGTHEEDHTHDHIQHPHAAHGTTYGSTSAKIANAHQNHIHSQPKSSGTGSGGHGHSHGDLNMRGVFLHVLGDALGNIGVIATALIIWLTTFPGRFYFDPAISLVITAIILTSAIPLCKAASRILLQAVPTGLSIDEIRADIEDLPQVVEAHHLHVWQLSDTKLVASLHVKVDCDVKGAGSASYMKLAREVRACLHGYGIHSSTIQPEFLRSASSITTDLLDDQDQSADSSLDTAVASAPCAKKSSKAGSMLSADGHSAGPGCMMDCEDTCGSTAQCCPSTDGKGASR